MNKENTLSLGSLFDGSGAFPLGGLIAGITPLWSSEVEPFPVRVTTKRFPDMKHYGDISVLNGAELPPVDIITFGSPCQDMSVAGKRSGLDGSRSSLFYEAIRIIKEMRGATDGKYPRYIVWENVPGAFGSSKGQDLSCLALSGQIRRSEKTPVLNKKRRKRLSVIHSQIDLLFLRMYGNMCHKKGQDPVHKEETIMMLHFNVTGDRRKALVKVIEEKVGVKAKYLKLPTYAYQIGKYNVSKEGCLSWADLDDADPESLSRTSDLIDACMMAGFEPEEWNTFRKQEEAVEEKHEEENHSLTVELPRSTFTDSQLENLQKLVDAKAPLLKQALAVTELPIIITDELVSFPWFTDDIDAESCAAYTCLITAICKMAKEAKRVTAKEKEVENAKYAFRCFLLRLGFIGDEYKQNRKILMKNLSGSSAFKSGTKKGGEQ